MDDLISEFITETSESLAVLDLELVKLEQNPNDKEILGNIFRLVHTVKGTCGFLGLPRLESVAHAGENVLGKIRDGHIIVTPEAISLVLEALDRIKTIMEQLAESGSEPAGDDKDLIARLNAFADSNGAVANTSAPTPAPAPKKNDINVANMLSPDEIKSGGGMTSSTTQDELDELERAFREAVPTIEGGVDYTKAPSTFMEDTPAVPAPAAAKPPLAEQHKDKAIKQGLETDAKDTGGGGAGVNQSIRVNLDVLEDLMQMVGELVLSRNQLMQIMRNRDDSDLKGPLQQLSQITTELQDGVMKTRMQPISTAWTKFPRLIRDLSQDLKKKIDLKMIGENTELDRQLLEMIKDPLTHMVRNSCDHGLEMPADRAAAGKPETGTVTLSAYHEGGHIIIKIADDGRGINLERVKQKALENGVTTKDELASLSDEQIMQFIFKAGFSTAEKVTSVSGRGVGMDVVRTNIEKIGGTVELSSTAGKGSTFNIKIPLTLAIVSVLLVEADKQRFGIPQLNVVELVRVDKNSEYKIETISNSKVLRLRGNLLPLASLNELLGLPKSDEQSDRDCYIVVVKAGASDYGLMVDAVHDTEEIVVKPVSRLLENVALYSGNTILGDGSVIMILDPNGIARALGEPELSGREEVENNLINSADRVASFLIFNTGGGAPKTVPLELVSRLEDIEIDKIEESAGSKVVQYRGDLMQLITLPGCDFPEAKDGEIPVIVFTYDRKTIGLVIDEILDIVQAPVEIKGSSQQEHFLGSMVIGSKTTDVVDVGYILKEIGGDISAIARKVDAVKDVELLLVEDSDFWRNLAEPLLQSVGYHVTWAEHGAMALSLMQAKAFDVIVSDIEMPQMDGFQFATAVRKDKRFDHIPIVAFTSTANEQFRRRAIHCGMQDMVTKTDREALLVAIAKQLQNNNQEAA
ncbi:MAG: chemotaxis protein CheW [Alphaproteobacteria bacterium]|nr:chemotaxis protein CheW [Alphaproteobacteria bacterium]